MPVISSENVSDFALKEAAYLVEKMIGHRKDIINNMISRNCRLVVMGHNEFTTQIPEYSHFKPAKFWDRRARGFGSDRNDPVMSNNNANPSRPGYNQDDDPRGYNPSRPVTSRPPYNRPTARPPYRPQTTERSYVAEDSWNNEGSGFDDDEGDSWDDDEDPFGMDDEEDDDGWGNFGRK